MHSVIILVVVFLLGVAPSFGQSLRRNVKRDVPPHVPLGTVAGYETRYGGFPQIGLWYFKPESSRRLEVRWWRWQGTYGWNQDYKAVNLTGVYNFLIVGVGANVNMLRSNEGSINWSVQPLIDIDLVYLTLFLGYNVNVVEEFNVKDTFNFGFQIDALSLMDTFFRR